MGAHTPEEWKQQLCNHAEHARKDLTEGEYVEFCEMVALEFNERASIAEAVIEEQTADDDNDGTFAAGEFIPGMDSYE